MYYHCLSPIIFLTHKRSFLQTSSLVFMTRHKHSKCFLFLREVVKTTLLEQDPPDHKIVGGVYLYPSLRIPLLPQRWVLCSRIVVLTSSLNLKQVYSYLWVYHWT